MRQRQRQPGYNSEFAKRSRRAARELNQALRDFRDVKRQSEQSHCKEFWARLTHPTAMLVFYFAGIEVVQRVCRHLKSEGKSRSRLRVTKMAVEAMSNDFAGVLEGSQLHALRDLANAALNGDKEAFGKLKKLVGEDSKLWGWFGDLRGMIANLWLELFTSSNLCCQDEIRRGLESLVDRLSLPADGPLARLAIDRVKMAWLQASYFEYSLRALSELSSAKESNRLMKRSEYATRQFHEALQSLAVIRWPRPVIGPSSRPPWLAEGPRR